MTHAELKEAIKSAMKNREEVKLSVLRGLSAAATNELVAKSRKPDEMLTDDELLSVIMRASKQRKDSIEQFSAGGRPELATSEQAELDILTAMLPAQMSREEIESAAKAKATELGVTDKTKANQLMGMLMKDLKGRADGNAVKEVINSLFP